MELEARTVRNNNNNNNMWQTNHFATHYHYNVCIYLIISLFLQKNLLKFDIEVGVALKTGI